MADQTSWSCCLVCGQSHELKRCARCKNDGVEYCSRECQKADWKVHGKLCRDLSLSPSDADGSELPPFELVDTEGDQRITSAHSTARTVLVLLHGVGDEARNFVGFGRKMELPNTRVVAITAPLPLPYAPCPHFVSLKKSEPPSVPAKNDLLTRAFLDAQVWAAWKVLVSCFRTRWRAGQGEPWRQAPLA